MAKKIAKNFESAMEELEKLIYNLEDGSLSLDESIKTYKKGMELAAFCSEALQKAEQEIYVLEHNAISKMNGEGNNGE